ncbi:MAG: DUF1786 domain-containing protein [Methanobrevibacter sp.]|jgi:uncharacterized protein (DUF1786 family)|nr:DUF1786 domain-containing protein [Candidatus Methanoflexus mossambicus]
MKCLAIDIGAGTQDIMIYDSNKNIENSIKLVLPSPSVIMVEKIKKINNNIYFDGEIMGGGKIKNAIIDKIKNGYKIAMETNPAKTVRDDLNQVKDIGIEIVNNTTKSNENTKTNDNNKINENNKNKFSNYFKLTLKDFDLNEINETIAKYEINLNYEYVAIALQDHGYNENMGDRDFRFEKIREKLNKPIAVEEFAFTKNIPEYFTRMKTVENKLKDIADKKYIIMDSKFASICGAMEDEYIKQFNSFVVLDIGNGHTMATSIENGLIQGVFEHHTSMLKDETGETLTNLINKLVDGSLTHEEVHENYGHGAHVLNPISKLEKVIVTGPNRNLIENTAFDYYNAVPAGDVMMTGPVGLIKSIKYHETIKNL